MDARASGPNEGIRSRYPYSASASASASAIRIRSRIRIYIGIRIRFRIRTGGAADDLSPSRFPSPGDRSDSIDEVRGGRRPPFPLAGPEWDSGPSNWGEFRVYETLSEVQGPSSGRFQVVTVSTIDPKHHARPASETARLLSLSFLDEANTAFSRIEKSKDPEALHDFRVALRRLWSTLRAYRPFVEDTVKKRLRERLRGLAASKGKGRDAEVGLAWLSEFSEALKKREMPGFLWLQTRLEARKSDEYEGVLSTVASDFQKVDGALRKRLAYCKIPVVGDEERDPPVDFSAAAGLLIAEHCGDLRRALEEWKHERSEEAAHEVRIGAKRLRYLLEPFDDSLSGASRVISGWKSFQDDLGDLNDLLVLRAEVERTEKEIEKDGLRPGVAKVATLADSQFKRRVRRFESRWLRGRAERLLDRSEKLAEKLSQAARRKGRSNRTPGASIIIEGRRLSRSASPSLGRPTGRR